MIDADVEDKEPICLSSLDTVSPELPISSKFGSEGRLKTKEIFFKSLSFSSKIVILRFILASIMV
jgi:hypothetical protein